MAKLIKVERAIVASVFTPDEPSGPHYDIAFEALVKAQNAVKKLYEITGFAEYAQMTKQLEDLKTDLGGMY